MRSSRAPVSELSGTKVLILEDEFYLAVDMAEAVRRAGGTALGPFPSAQAVHAGLAGDTPDCAIVDINLGRGPSFEIAEMLVRSGIPFLFVTGYDKATIPKEFAHIDRVEKPVEMAMVLQALCKLKDRAAPS